MSERTLAIEWSFMKERASTCWRLSEYPQEKSELSLVAERSFTTIEQAFAENEDGYSQYSLCGQGRIMRRI